MVGDLEEEDALAEGAEMVGSTRGRRMRGIEMGISTLEMVREGGAKILA